MREWLNNASPEVLTKLAALDDEKREQTLEFCDRLMARVEDARENLPAAEYREFLQWITTMLQVKALKEHKP